MNSINYLKIYLFFILFSVLLSPATAQLPALEAFGDSIEQTLARQDASFMNERFNVDSLLSRTLIQDKSIIELEEANRELGKEFKKGFKFGDLILKQLQVPNAFYEFIRAYEKDGEQHLIFRLYSDAGLNYHDFLIYEDSTQYGIKDVYFYLTGENFSTTLKSFYTPLISNALGNKVDLFDEEFDALVDLEKIKEWMQFGQMEKALKLLDALPPHIQQRKIAKIFRIEITTQLDEDQYFAAIEDYEHTFPNDPSKHLISMEGFLLHEEYPKALDAIDSLDLIVGGDPLLNFFRGNIYFATNEIDKSAAYFETVAKEVPYMVDAYDGLLTLKILQNENEAACDILDIFIRDFEFEKTELISFIRKEFSDGFAQSKHFLEWIDNK